MTRLSLPLVAAAVFVALLASCAAPDGNKSSLHTLSVDRPVTPSAALTSGGWHPGIAPVRARPELKPAFVANPDPRALIGLERADVAALLGQPKLLRRDPPAELWQYLSEACVLHVFMYVTGNEGHYRVRHVEVRDRQADVAAPHCYAELINAPSVVPNSG